MPRPNPNQMVVEGYEDLHAIVELMGHHIEWPADRHQAPVFIEIGKSVSEILEKTYLPLKLKQSGLQALSVVIDADDRPLERWTKLRSLLATSFPSIPVQPMSGGYVDSNEEGLRLGLWLMPDNSSNGMLETFLKYLVPSEDMLVWAYAKHALKTARRKGASYRDVHLDKAAIHTWLAWQDPPGEKFGVSIAKSTLNPHAAAAVPFVEWFKRVYEIK